MNDSQKKKYRKFLSYVLRHHPEAIGMDFDVSGYVGVEILLNALQKAGKPLTREELEEILATNDKKRFAFSSDGSMIRAS
jgi:putative RNA 2'-phosphotransferase